MSVVPQTVIIYFPLSPTFCKCYGNGDFAVDSVITRIGKSGGCKNINSRINVENKPPVGPDVSDILNNICQIIRTNRKLRSKDKVDVPLAVCLTKCDVLLKAAENEEEDKVLFGPGSSVLIPREHGRFDRENFEQIDVELEEYLRRTVGDNFIQMVNGFDEHCYFAVSALGCNPTGSTLPRGVSPMRVEDPFIWLLNREGLR